MQICKYRAKNKEQQSKVSGKEQLADIEAEKALVTSPYNTQLKELQTITIVFSPPKTDPP